MSPFKERDKRNEYMRGYRKRKAERVRKALALLEEQEKNQTKRG